MVADAVHQAGDDQLMHFVASREAAEAMEPRCVPVDYVIVDDVEVRP